MQLTDGVKLTLSRAELRQPCLHPVHLLGFWSVAIERAGSRNGVGSRCALTHRAF
jgi:hypothetical protein